jgi:hypothetical protein
MSQNTPMPRDEIHDYIATLPGVIPLKTWGELSYFYNPGRSLPRGTYFATIKDHDGDNDRASALNCDGVWRLNMGVSKAAFLERFGPPPPRPAKGRVIEGPWDFVGVDKLTPHPVYGWMSWVATLNPTTTTWRDECISLLVDAHKRAQVTFVKRGR